MQKRFIYSYILVASLAISLGINLEIKASEGSSAVVDAPIWKNARIASQCTISAGLGCGAGYLIYLINQWYKKGLQDDSALIKAMKYCGSWIGIGAVAHTDLKLMSLLRRTNSIGLPTFTEMDQLSKQQNKISKNIWEVKAAYMWEKTRSISETDQSKLDELYKQKKDVDKKLFQVAPTCLKLAIAQLAITVLAAYATYYLCASRDAQQSTESETPQQPESQPDIAVVEVVA